jgi:2-succinyl-5-enolpyruvyl-6-hydroxy-3-cyclohexene-1-carboxylate synthase
MVSEAINLTQQGFQGPVHLNIPLREPLYNTIEDTDDRPKLIDVTPFEQRITEEALLDLANLWNASQKKMIVVGGLKPNESLKDLLKSFAEREDTVVLTESISNLPGYPFLDRIDPVVELISELEDDSDFIPEILISLGGGLVSKKLKFLLRRHRPQEHWHITDSNQHWDTFQSLTKVLNCHPQGFLSSLKSQTKDSTSGFHEAWHTLSNKAVKWTKDYLTDKAFSDFKIFEMFIPKIPKGTCLHLGNSTPVRYANLFSLPEGIRVFSNRGISGIDGVVSTAAGASYNHKDLTVCVTGDLGFFYDSNAWWNQQLKPNFRVVLINNGGGNIFRIIPGPNTAPGYPEFYEAPQEADAASIANAFGVEYDQCADRESTNQKIDWLLDSNAAKARILEFKTSNQESAKLLRNYLSYLKSRNNE